MSFIDTFGICIPTLEALCVGIARSFIHFLLIAAEYGAAANRVHWTVEKKFVSQLYGITIQIYIIMLYTYNAYVLCVQIIILQIPEILIGI